MPKIRTYKVQTDVNGVPYIPIKGKFLSKDFNLQAGDHVEVIPANGAVILRELSTAEISLKQSTRLRTTFKNLLNACESYLSKHEHQLIKYVDHEQFIDHLQECGQVAFNLQILALDEAVKSHVFDIINTYKSQLATCQQSFYETQQTVLINIALDTYQYLVELLRDCGQRLGILSKQSNVMAFKKKVQNKQAKHCYSNRDYSQFGGLMIAENKSNAYSVEAEYTRLGIRRNRTELSQLAKLVCENNI